MRKNYLEKTGIFCLFIFFVFLYFSAGEILLAGEESEETHFVDTGYITGSIVSVIDSKEVKVDMGTKDGLKIKQSKGDIFTVVRKNVPVALLEADDIGDNESVFKVKETLEGITLEAGDMVTSEGCSLNTGDLKILESSYCELLSKTLIGNKAEKVRWKIDPVYIDVLGDAYLFVSYGHPTLSTGSGEALPIIFGGDETSLVFLFDSLGERKWGYFTERCIFRGEADMSLGFFNTYIEFSSDEPDYSISGDKLFLNVYENKLDPWAVMEFMKANGIYISLDLMTGNEVWKFKAPGEDPAFYQIINNSVKKESYLYSSEKGVYGVNMEKGEFIWEFKMKSDGSEEGIFIFKDGSLYASDDEKGVYKINEKGDPLWEFEGESQFAKIQFSDKEDSGSVYLFDNKKSLYSVNRETGDIIWHYEGDKSFTSPEVNQVSGDKVYTFDEGGIVILSADTGGTVSKIELKKPVPLSFDNDFTYCISDNKAVCGVDLTGGRVAWSYEADNEITKVFHVKDALYVLDKKNIYVIDKVTGKEFLKKEDLVKPEYLKKYVPSPDPYSITNLGKVEDEEKVVLVKGQNGFVSISPVTHEIISERKFEEELLVAVGDSEKFYIASEKKLWAVDANTGEILWEKGFEEKITFLAKPEKGQIYYEEEEYYKSRHTITSRSDKLIGLQAGEEFYILDKATGETVNSGISKETLYPCLEMEAMNKIGEKGEAILFYCYEDSLYAFKRLVVSN